MPWATPAASRRTWATSSASRSPAERHRHETWKGLGPGVLEVVEAHDGNAYRAVYALRLEKAVYVLHVFQKKSPSGIRTASRDVDHVAQRLRTAEKNYEEHYGKPKR